MSALCWSRSVVSIMPRSPVHKKKGLFSSKSTEFPTQPGIYTQTATVSGNYSCEKITRTIVIN